MPSHYSIRSQWNADANSGHLKSWRVEVSLKGSDWTEIDHRENNSELNGKNVTAIFSVSKPEVCRFVRLVNIGRNHAGNDALVISSFEIFGSLVGPGAQLTAFHDRFQGQFRALGMREFRALNLSPLNGIISQLTRECGGNVHDHDVVVVTSSGPVRSEPNYAAKNVVDLEADSWFHSAWRKPEDDIPHTRNYWICYDFKGRRLIPMGYAIRSRHDGGYNGSNPKSWLVESSINGEDWIEIDHHEDNAQLNGRNVTVTFQVSKHEVCRFVRFVNIGRNHARTDALIISSFEIFGYLAEAR